MDQLEQAIEKANEEELYGFTYEITDKEVLQTLLREALWVLQKRGIPQSEVVKEL